MSKTTKTVSLSLVCLLTLFFSGCVETEMMFRGNKPSSSMNVVALQQGPPQAGTWQTYQVVVDYKYSQNAATLDISGQAALSASYQTNYASLNDLKIYLFFLDEDSRVLETINLASSKTSDVDEVLTFSSEYAVPAESKAISFGYDGSAGGAMGKIGGGIAYFSELPLKK
jgi:hypothetical protein